MKSVGFILLNNQIIKSNMNFKTLFIAIFAFSAFSFTNPTHITTVSVDAEASTIAWKGYKVTGEHAGTVKVKEGKLNFDHGTLVGGSFSIDMNSMVCTDLQGEYGQKLVGHLASDDFFGVANFPTANFEITKAIAYADGDYKVVGNLTIKETTQEISFRANVAKDGTATAKIVVDRSKFNIKYGSGSFFDGLGDKTIYDEFDLDVTLKLAK